MRWRVWLLVAVILSIAMPVMAESYRIERGEPSSVLTLGATGVGVIHSEFNLSGNPSLYLRVVSDTRPSIWEHLTPETQITIHYLDRRNHYRGSWHDDLLCYFEGPAEITVIAEIQKYTKSTIGDILETEILLHRFYFDKEVDPRESGE
jgi:hypothetical protein